MSTPLIYSDIRPEDIYYPISTKEVIKTEQIWISNEDIFPEFEEYKSVL